MYYRSELIFLIQILLLTSCLAPPTSKYEPRDYVTDYAASHVYELKQPVFLVHVPRDSNYPRIPDYELWPEGHGHEGVPSSILEYQKDGSKAWPQVVKILQPGTHIQYRQTEMTTSIDFGRIDHPLGTIVDGGPVVSSYINLLWISKREGATRGTNIDPDFLEDVKP